MQSEAGLPAQTAGSPPEAPGAEQVRGKRPAASGRRCEVDLHGRGMREAPAAEEDAVTRSAEYVGSFHVDDRCLDDQIQQLDRQLESLKTSRRQRLVSLKFSIKGVKMYDEDEATLLMAHALRRVSLSMARPSDEQFAFVSHNPGSLDAQLYCHLFRARHARAAQFLNLLMCRCFQLSYIQRHPEEVEEDVVSPLPTHAPYLLNQGFPLSVNALVSFRRAPMLGLLSGEKSSSLTSEEQPSSSEEGQISSPTLVRKKAIRNKVLRSGAYRSFTCTPHRQRHLQDQLTSSQGKTQNGLEASRGRSPSLAETEEALAEAVWSWAGISRASSSSLLEEDVLGAFLLSASAGDSDWGSVTVRSPSGLATYSIRKSPENMYMLENCMTEFDSIAALIERYHEDAGELEYALSCARVNHCYEWDEKPGGAPAFTIRKASVNI
ncbi:SH2 domain-containing protein 5 [Paramormyrops kingsleyae]|uniref:SH2 domain-containing protein 5 n=1 Tax=Paramormyrops kingsleyae TaxID=1676925 RepID=UPI003B97BA0B